MLLDKTLKKTSTIMIVDDEPMVTGYLGKLFKMNGFHILISNCGEYALRLFKDSSDEIDLIITDLNMPRLTGLKLSKIILET